jgi:hypothetical protein
VHLNLLLDWRGVMRPFRSTVTRMADELERLYLLPSDATPLQRALAYRPHQCGEAWRHRNRVIVKLCREQGLPLPWSQPPPPSSR